MNGGFLHKAFRELVGEAPGGVSRVRGGDINGGYRVETPSSVYFCKARPDGGPLPQDNTPAASWGEFYVERRLLPLIRQGVERGLFKTNMLDKTRSLRVHIPEARPALSYITECNALVDSYANIS